MQLREMHAGEKWEGEHVKVLGWRERESREDEKFSQRNQRWSASKNWEKGEDQMI